VGQGSVITDLHGRFIVSKTTLSRVYTSATCCLKQHVARNKQLVARNMLLVARNMLLVSATCFRATCCAGVNAALVNFLMRDSINRPGDLDLLTSK